MTPWLPYHMQSTKLAFCKTFLFLLFLVACSEEEESKSPPNVIILMTDDQGYGDLGCHGNPIIQTPNLDALHAESVRFTDFHVDPTCSPTRAALMTGRYSRRVGVWHTVMGRNLLRREEANMAELFKNSGYATGHFGKWHLGGNYPYRPNDRGFDSWVGHGDGGTGTANDHWGNDKMNDTYLRNGKKEKFEGFSTDIYFEEAMQFIEQQAENPFFIYLATNVPHRPWNIKAEWATPYRNQLEGRKWPLAHFYASIGRVDQNLGRLRGFLKTKGLSENTIIIFLTDNGSSSGFIKDDNGESFAYNAGMRGFKGSEYEGGHRVPLFMSWEGGDIRHGTDIEKLTAHIDLLPTLVELCQLKTPDSLQFDGRSLAPLLRGDIENWQPRTLLVESQRIKYPEKWRQSCMMTEEWRLINGKELYKISQDSGQQNDVAEQHPAVVAKIRNAYEELWAELSVKDSLFERPIVGTDAEPETMLHAQDWAVHSEDCSVITPWNQPYILNGIPCRGYWPIEVAIAGTYRIALSRWPKELRLPIAAAYSGQTESDIFRPTRTGISEAVILPQGMSLPIQKAGIRVADIKLEQAVDVSDTEVVFSVELPKGEQELEAWFATESNQTWGAYYVEISKVDESL